MRVLLANTVRALGANHPQTIVAGNRGFLVTAHPAVLSTRGLVHNLAPSTFRLPSWLPGNMSGAASDSMPVSSFVGNSCSSPQSTRTVICTAELDHIQNNMPHRLPAQTSIKFVQFHWQCGMGLVYVLICLGYHAFQLCPAKRFWQVLLHPNVLSHPSVQDQPSLPVLASMPRSLGCRQLK